MFCKKKIAILIFLWENIGNVQARNNGNTGVMELGVVVGIAAISIMTLIAVLMGIVAAVSTVSGIDTRDNEGD